ncbi:glycosyltransferase family 4 protein [Leptolyngbya sp. 7M]|uniref:glycosyltransferase family 4 protein n=1 Tax=Leptolyngbya sp. 7M TaxID=2812896 RepID=UPI001CECA30D|nr:glycosyltransferase family 1 protein [Leptolyngbya sp. 7M]
MEFISLHQQRTVKERLWLKFPKQIRILVAKIKDPKMSRIETYEERLVRSLVNREVDVLLYLSQTYVPIMDIPYVAVVWDLAHRLHPYFPEVSNQGEWERRERGYGIRLKRAVSLITGTKVGQTEIQQFYQIPEERIKVLPFPTPQFALDASNHCTDSVLSKYQLPKNYLFYPAQFWPHKNHVGLLLAVKWLRDRYDLIFPVVFTGSDKGNQTYVRQIVNDLNLSQQVHFLGFVSQDDLVSIYQNAFALTFLTFFGPDNLPPLEAFALKCPVIASEVPGAQEQLGDAALLVNPKSVEEIALAIKSLLEDDNLRETLIQRGLIKAAQWSTKDYAEGIFEILDDFETIRRCWSSRDSWCF